MTWLCAVELAAPLILIGWLVCIPARSILRFVVQVFGSLSGSLAVLAVMALRYSNHPYSCASKVCAATLLCASTSHRRYSARFAYQYLPSVLTMAAIVQMQMQLPQGQP